MNSTNRPTLRVLTWNISYAYGLGSEGISSYGYKYTQKNRDHFEFVLNAMGDLLMRLDLDLVFLQEVDFNSARSHHLNQLEWLSRRSGLLYRDAIVSWDHPYVPYPGIHPKNHFRSVKSGGGVLSRYPVESLQSDLLAKPRENGRIYNSFYLSRYLQILKTHHPVFPQELHLLNAHLEAFSESNRELHWLRFSERLRDFEVLLAAGDFNGNAQLTPDAQTRWEALEPPQPTFPSHRPERALDGFILQKDRFQILNHEVLDSGDLSDHRPILLELSGTY